MLIRVVVPWVSKTVKIHLTVHTGLIYFMHLHMSPSILQLYYPYVSVPQLLPMSPASGLVLSPQPFFTLQPK